MRLALASLLALASPALAQVPYTLDVDPAQSAAVWDGQTTVGPVNGNQNFQFDGTVGVSAGSATFPFGTGQFNGGELQTIPPTLSGHIPNPIPILPPLATIDLRDLRAATTSLPFSVGAALGYFSTIATLEFTAGEIEIDPFVGGAVIVPMAGLLSDPFPVDGHLSESGGRVIVDAPIYVSFAINVGVSGTFTITGDLFADAAVGNPAMTVAVQNLVSGGTASFSADGGLPNAETYLIYSVAGTGSTTVPQLNVTLGITSPILGAGPTRTDSNGHVDWNLPVPGAAAGRTVWYQAAQAAVVSNVGQGVVQ